MFLIFSFFCCFFNETKKPVVKHCWKIDRGEKEKKKGIDYFLRQTI